MSRRIDRYIRLWVFIFHVHFSFRLASPRRKSAANYG
jgi:hypothetical protein